MTSRAATTAIAVVERKNPIKRALSALIAEHGASGCALRVLSIASGPAQEVYEQLGHLLVFRWLARDGEARAL